MRRCRYWRCRCQFWPEKEHYYYCSWDCRVADVGADYARDYRGHQRSSDQSYDRGWNDAWRSRPSPADLEMPPAIWKGLILLCHPDKYAQELRLQAVADEVTRWLIEHKPNQH